MAIMIPRVCSPATKSMAEAALFPQLEKQLDGSYYVFHSFGILARNLENVLVDREIDYLVCSREHGVLALEVKGGVIAYDGRKGTWLQNGHPLELSPVRQAMENKYAIRSYLEKKMGTIGRITLGHAVCFPDVFGEVTDLPAEADRRIVITGEQVAYLEEAIPAILAGFAKGPKRKLAQAEWSRLTRALMPEFEFGASLVDRMAASEKKLFALTEEQYALLDILGERRRVLIRGCAGTGKTILAVKKAQELAARRMRVLLLCYNSPLAALLKESVAGHGDITAETYHAFCMRKLQESGVRMEIRADDPDFWRYEVPQRFDTWLGGNPLTYDAVIVDEAQDFMWPYWMTIEKLLPPEGYLYIFYDPDQNLYGTDLQFPIEGEPYVLRKNCRNTARIARKLMEYSAVRMDLREGAPEGEPVVEVRCAFDHELRKALGRALHRMIIEGRLSKDRVVILGGHNIENTCLAAHNVVGSFTIAEKPRKGADVVRYSTYMRFKGCEADAVIILGVDPKDERWSGLALYTAMSRAKHLLYVLYKE